MRDREKLREAQARWYQEVVKPRRDKWFKENGPCKECGSDENLEAHHIDKNTKESHNVWTWAEERRLKELSKCIVLCRACHRKLHRTVKHGTIFMYEKYACRCDECKQAKAVKNKKYKESVR